MLSKPKILLTANMDWYLYNYRLALARQTRLWGGDVVLLSAPDPGTYVSALQEAGFRWIFWRGERRNLNPFKELAAFFHFYRIFRQEKPHLVHLHTIKPVLYGSLAARLAGVPAVICSITGRGYVFTSKSLKARLIKPLVRMLYRLAFRCNARQEVIFENRGDLAEFTTTGLLDPQRAHLIRGVGVDIQRFKPAPEPEGEPVVLMSSRMLWDKGVGVFVEAARLVKQRTKVRFVLAGTPDPSNPTSIPEDTLRAWEKEGLITWLGWQADMPGVYAQCHIAVLPTMYGEGVPTVLLEAGACGRALIATDLPSCREVIENGANGLLVPLGDASALAEAIIKLIDNPSLRRQMGSANRELMESQFTDTQVNRETLKIYTDILTGLL